jgi:hypothetical protein
LRMFCLLWTWQVTEGYWPFDLPGVFPIASGKEKPRVLLGFPA